MFVAMKPLITPTFIFVGLTGPERSVSSVVCLDIWLLNIRLMEMFFCRQPRKATNWVSTGTSTCLLQKLKKGTKQKGIRTRGEVLTANLAIKIYWTVPGGPGWKACLQNIQVCCASALVIIDLWLAHKP